MKKYLLALICLLSFFAGCGHQNSAIAPPAVKGIIDLSEWDFSSNETVDLDGEWEFYWNALISPEDISSGKKNFTAEYITNCI